MRNRIPWIAALGLVVALVAALAGCALGPPVALRTSPVAHEACDAALMEGTLAPNPRSGLGVVAGGVATAVEWPFGYSARHEGTRIALLDETGRVVAYEGDTVRLGGGLGSEDVWYACDGVTVVAPGG